MPRAAEALSVLLHETLSLSGLRQPLQPAAWAVFDIISNHKYGHCFLSTE